MNNKDVLSEGLRVEVFYSPDGAVSIYNNAIDIISGDLPPFGSQFESIFCLDQYGNHVELMEVVGHDCFSADLKELSSIGEMALAIKDLECTIRRPPNDYNISEVERLSGLIDNSMSSIDKVGSLEKAHISLDVEELINTTKDATGYLLQGKGLESSSFTARLTDWEVGLGIKKGNEKDVSTPSPSL